jgi:hypothetical protein
MRWAQRQLRSMGHSQLWARCAKIVQGSAHASGEMGQDEIRHHRHRGVTGYGSYRDADEASLGAWAVLWSVPAPLPRRRHRHRRRRCGDSTFRAGRRSLRRARLLPATAAGLLSTRLLPPAGSGLLPAAWLLLFTAASLLWQLSRRIFPGYEPQNTKALALRSRRFPRRPAARACIALNVAGKPSAWDYWALPMSKWLTSSASLSAP